MNYAPHISNALRAAAGAARNSRPPKNARERIRNSAHGIFIHHLERGLRHSYSAKYDRIGSFASCWGKRNELEFFLEFHVNTTSVESYKNETMPCNVVGHLLAEREPDTVLSAGWESFYRLIMSNARDKLFIGAFVDDALDYLNTLEIIGNARMGGLQVALIPHYGAWKGLQVVDFELWAWDSERWVKVVGLGA